jgi:hypothetical protein
MFWINREVNSRYYLDSLDLEFKRGVFIDNDHGVTVQLEAGERPHMVDASLDTFL